MSALEGIAAVVTGTALRRGLPELSALILGEVASVGGDHWRTDAAVQASIAEKTGWTYHRESIGRSRRRLALVGILQIKRIFTGQLPSPAAKFKSSHGTSRSQLNWKALDLRPPAKAQQKRDRARQDAETRAREAVAPQKNDYPERAGSAPGPRFSAPAPGAPPAPAPLPAELAAIVERLGARIDARQSAREAAEDAATVAAVERARPRPPPD